jgi:ATPase subunit of ABC transporter with duplicated ATPase domains
VLDEPEQRLDAAGLEWLAGRLSREKADGLGVLLASHAPQLLEAIDVRVIDVGA